MSIIHARYESVTIASGETTSNILDLGGHQLVGVELPAYAGFTAVNFMVGRNTAAVLPLASGGALLEEVVTAGANNIFDIGNLLTFNAVQFSAFAAPSAAVNISAIMRPI